MEQIVVHRRSEPWKKKSYTRQVDVSFNFVCEILRKRKAVGLKSYGFSP